MDTSATTEDTSATNGDITDSASRHDTDTLIESLQDQVEYLRREVEVWQDEAWRKDHLLAAALERIPAIEAPSDTTDHNTSLGERESPETAAEEESKGEETPYTERRSWLSKFFFGP